MSDTIERPSAPNTQQADQPTDAVRPTGWRRSHTITLLIALSLAPGFAAAIDREWWHALPPGVRMSAYVLSGVLIVAACSLILARDESPPDTQP
jgi:hypothetical protein